MSLQRGDLSVVDICEARDGVVLLEPARYLLVCPARYAKDRQLLCDSGIVALDMTGIVVFLIVSSTILIQSDRLLAVAKGR